MAWEHLQSRLLHSFKIFNLIIDKVRNKKTGQELDLVMVSGPDAANVICLTPDGLLVMVRQYRFGTREWTIELPGGLVEKEENIEKACARELLEETGYKAERWQYIGKVPSNPVFMDSYVHHFIAWDASYVQEPQLDEEEVMEVQLVSMDELAAAISSGDVSHPHTLSALMKAKGDFVFNFAKKLD